MSLSANFHDLTTFGSLVIKLWYFEPRGNNDVMLGVEILKFSKIYHHQSIQRPQISRDANFHISMRFHSLVIKFRKL